MSLVLGILAWTLVSAAAVFAAARHVNARLVASVAAGDKAGASAAEALAAPAAESTAAATLAEGSNTAAPEDGTVAARQKTNAELMDPTDHVAADEAAVPTGAVAQPASTEPASVEATDAEPASAEATDAEPASAEPASAEPEEASSVRASQTVGGAWSATPYAWGPLTYVLSAVLLVPTVAVAASVTTNLTEGVMVTPSAWPCLLVGYAGVLAAAVVDAKLRLIPNVVVLSMLVVRLPLYVYQFMTLPSSMAQSLLLGSVVGFFGSLVLLGLVGLLTRGGIGGGDVKLVAALGFDCGLKAALVALTAGLSVFCVVALVLVLVRRHKWHDSLPFAPFLYVGFSAALMVSLY